MKKINNKIKEKVKKMKGKSCWLINDKNSLQRLNFKKPTRENVRFLIECYDCIALDKRDPEIHVFYKSQYQNYQKRENKNYQFR